MYRHGILPFYRSRYFPLSAVTILCVCVDMAFYRSRYFPLSAYTVLCVCVDMAFYRSRYFPLSAYIVLCVYRHGILPFTLFSTVGLYRFVCV